MKQELIAAAATLCVLFAGTSAQAEAAPYPEPMRVLMGENAQKIVCELNNGKSTIFYYSRYRSEHPPNGTAERLVRVYAKNGEELEAWVNHDDKRLNDKGKLTRSALWKPDKIYYRTPEEGWIDKDRLDSEKSEYLAQRITFSLGEIISAVKCFNNARAK